MKIIPVLVCLVVISIVQAKAYTKVSKPKLSLVDSQNKTKSQTHHVKKHKLPERRPEERRQHSLFPKSNKKFVVTSEPHHKHVTHKQKYHGTKKPLMRKIVIQDKRNTAVSYNIKQPRMNNKLYDNDLPVIQIMEPHVINKELIQEKSEESQKIKIEGNDTLQSNNKELNATAIDIDHRESLGIKDVIVTSTIKSVKENLENKSEEGLSDEITDLKEFIFLDPVQNPTETDKMSSEASDEYLTTEIPEEPINIRRKRGSNVIEEENLGTTVAGYKYTWKDTRLYNDMVFKNINS